MSDEERRRGNGLDRATEAVGAAIRDVRIAHGVTLSELSKRLTRQGRPIHVSGLSKMENGERRIDVDDLFEIAEALNTSMLRLVAYAAAENSEDKEAWDLASQAADHERALNVWRRVMEVLEDDFTAHNRKLPFETKGLLY